MKELTASAFYLHRLVDDARCLWDGAGMASASGPAGPDTIVGLPSRATGPVRRWHATMLVPQLAKAIVVAVFGGFCLIAFLRILYLPLAPVHVALAALYFIALLWLQLFIFSRPSGRISTPAAYLALVAQASLVYLPLFQFKQAWVGQPGFLAGSALLVLPQRLAWATFGTIVASMAYIQTVLSERPIDVAFTCVSTVITGLVVYGLSRLATLVTELHDARTELAHMAVAQERLRFARDLHDLLGYSLSAITLKSELTHRLVTKNPYKAQEELSEILDISRKALSDVRSVASGYRELSLDDESESARSVLVAADVDVRMNLDYGDLPAPVRTVLATVLREGVTNVLRHSKAEQCEITVRQADNRVTIDIVNDGVQAPTERQPRGGSGLHNLKARVAALQGKLNAGIDHDGRYRLHAAVPVTPQTRAS
jgi:two-component system, NarL family, sensor histidine kinase DesK